VPFVEPPQLAALGQGPEGQALLAEWAPHLAALAIVPAAQQAVAQAVRQQQQEQQQQQEEQEEEQEEEEEEEEAMESGQEPPNEAERNEFAGDDGQQAGARVSGQEEAQQQAPQQRQQEQGQQQGQQGQQQAPSAAGRKRANGVASSGGGAAPDAQPLADQRKASAQGKAAGAKLAAGARSGAAAAAAEAAAATGGEAAPGSGGAAEAARRAALDALAASVLARQPDSPELVSAVARQSGLQAALCAHVVELAAGNERRGDGACASGGGGDAGAAQHPELLVRAGPRPGAALWQLTEHEVDARSSSTPSRKVHGSIKAPPRATLPPSLRRGCWTRCSRYWRAPTATPRCSPMRPRRPRLPVSASRPSTAATTCGTAASPASPAPPRTRRCSSGCCGCAARKGRGAGPQQRAAPALMLGRGPPRLSKSGRLTAHPAGPQHPLAAPCRRPRVPQVLLAMLEEQPASPLADALAAAQDALVGYCLAAGVVHRIAAALTLFDRPQVRRAGGRSYLQRHARARRRCEQRLWLSFCADANTPHTPAKPTRSPKAATTPVPPYVLQCLRLLRTMTAPRGADAAPPGPAAGGAPARPLLPGRRWPDPGPNTASLVLALHETAMAGLLGLLTSVLLHANAPPSAAAAAASPTPAAASMGGGAPPAAAAPPPRQLPANFVEAARLVMQALTNVCRRDLLAAQQMLASAHNRLEFFHLVGFLLAYCTEQWPAPGDAAAANAESPLSTSAAAASAAAASAAAASAASAAAAAGGLARAGSVERGPPLLGALLDEVLLLVGFFAVDNPSNQVQRADGRGGRRGRAAAPPAGSRAGGLDRARNPSRVAAAACSLPRPVPQGMLQWGEVSIIQRLAQAPAPYFSEPSRAAVAAPALVAALFRAGRGCDQAARFMGLGLLADFLEAARCARAAAAGAATRGGHEGGAASSGGEASGSEGGGGRPGLAAAAARVPPRFALEARFPAALIDEAAAFFAMRAAAAGSAAGAGCTQPAPVPAAGAAPVGAAAAAAPAALAPAAAAAH
jgi:hypothetical protein